MKTLWYTGARISELLGIEKNHAADEEAHLDFGLLPKRIEDNRTIILKTIKRTTETEDEGRAYNVDERMADVPEKLVDELREYIDMKAIEDDERVFPYTSGWAYTKIAEVGEEAGIEPPSDQYNNIRPHLFRHSYAVANAKANPTIEGAREIQEELDHKDLSTTAHYLQFGKKEERAKKKEEILGRPDRNG